MNLWFGKRDGLTRQQAARCSWMTERGNCTRVALCILGAVLLLQVTAWPAKDGTEFRGANITIAGVGDHELEMLAVEWNANLVRVRLGANDQCGYSIVEIENPGTSDDATLLELDELIATCQTLGIRVILDIHQFPGFSHPGSPPEDYRLWTDAALQQRFIQFWRGMAFRYADWGDVIYGYDILNEPRGMNGDTSVWLDLAERTVHAIREVDTERPIIIESRVGRVETFVELVPIDDPNVIYSVHFWRPSEVVFQGLWGLPTGVDYPTSKWNADDLWAAMRPVIEFQERYGVSIFVGELGATAYMSPNSRQVYLSDVLSMVEELGYDYTISQYHQFGSLSLEHIGYQARWGDIPLFVGETEALSILKEYLARNERPDELVERRKPTCLFDTSHWAAGEDSNVVSLDYAWRLSAPCDIYYHNSGEITVELLEGLDLLITGNSHGRGYTSAEIRAIHGFVKSGGALLCYEGTVSSSSINRLLSPFGISHNPTVLFSEEPAWLGDEGDSYWAEVMNVGDAFSCISCSYHIAWGGSLAISEPAEAIASSGADSWRDTIQNGEPDSSEMRGPFTVIARSELGLGRAVVVADETMNQVCNWATMSQLVDWLLEGAYARLEYESESAPANDGWSRVHPLVEGED